MVQSSFYGDTPNYATDYPTQNDSNTNTGPNTPAPSSFYPDGGVYNALANSDAVLVEMTALEAQTAAAAAAASSSASAASTSAANAAASAASSAAAVAAAAGTATPLVNGTAAVGTSTKWAHEDHVHPTDTSRADAAATTSALALKAPLASPALTGTPTAPTATAGTNTTQLATTAFVEAARVILAAADALKAPLASPALTGTPTVPTAAVNTNTTQAASTAFVLAQGASAAPLVDGTAAVVGTATKYAREDHVHPTDTSRAPFEALAFNNIIVNGGMEVDQEHAGAAVTLGGNTYIVDGWLASKVGTMVITGQQVADAPPGFTNSIKITVGTAQASLGASDAALLITPIEGFRTSRLQMGTASALSFTLGFWTKIHRTGPYSGSVRNSATSRSYPFSFTQNVADTWEYKTVTIPGDVAGTWIGNTNGVGLYLTLTMAAGSTISGTANAWAGSNYAGVTGTTNGVAATTDVFQITGVSLLPGSVAVSAASSPLLKRSVDQELRLCKRYYEPIYFSAALAQAFISCLLTSTFYYHYWQFHVEKRAVPTIGLGTGVWQNANPTGTSATTDGVLFNHGTTYFYISGTASTIAAYADARL